MGKDLFHEANMFYKIIIVVDIEMVFMSRDNGRSIGYRFQI